jgi:hypothetical protein
MLGPSRISVAEFFDAAQLAGCAERNRIVLKPADGKAGLRMNILCGYIRSPALPSADLASVSRVRESSAQISIAAAFSGHRTMLQARRADATD